MEPCKELPKSEGHQRLMVMGVLRSNPLDPDQSNPSSPMGLAEPASQLNTHS